MCVDWRVLFDAAGECEFPPPLANGRPLCLAPYIYGITCVYECDSGYMFDTPANTEIECIVTPTVKWDGAPSSCKSKPRFLLLYSS